MNKNTKTIVIRSEILIDGSSNEPLKDAGIRIEGDQITRVEAWNNDESWSRGENVIKLKTRALIPGLINMHVHITDKADIDNYINNGITSVRDVGEYKGNQFKLSLIKNNIESGQLQGPSIFSYGKIIDGPKSLFPQITVSVSNEEEAKAEVDRQVAAGADGIKVYWKLPPQLIKTVIARSKKHGLPIAGHIGVYVGGVEGGQMGIDTIEHTISFMRDLVLSFIQPLMDPITKTGIMDDPTRGLGILFNLWRKVDTKNKRIRRIAEDFSKTGAAFHPTLVTFERLSRCGELVKENDTRHKERLESSVIKGLYDNTIPKKWNRKLSRIGQGGFDGMLRFTNLMYRTGVPIGVGTDDIAPFVYPGESLHDELALLVRSGIPSFEVIRMATAQNARSLKRDDLGVIAANKTADLVLLNRDPCEDITATREIECVIKGGEIVYSKS